MSGNSLLVFTSKTCRPCVMHKKSLEQIKPELEKVNTSVKVVDVYDEPELAADYGVSSVPATLLIEGDEVGKVHFGALTVDELSRFCGIK